MSMKITTSLVVLILLCIGISAQSASNPSAPKTQQQQQQQQQQQSQQQEKKIKIINSHTHQVIEDVHFSYGKLSGFSDEDGFIILNLKSGLTLTISHLSYEPKVFTEAQLKQLIEMGRIYLTPRATYRIEPVMVLALGTANHHSLEVGVSETDRVQHDAGALLKQINGISGIRKSGNYGFDPVFRGYKYDQLNIVFNGVQTATAACPNRMDPPVSQIALNQVERVEVLKGPHALRYGPAFGATINFVGSTIHEEDDPGWFGRVSGGGEGNGSVARTEAIVGTQNENLLFSLNGAYSKGDDYEDGNGNKVASAFERGTFGVYAGGELVQGQWYDIAINRNFARDVDFPALPMDMRTDDTWTINVNNKSVFKGHSKLNTSLYATLVDHEMDNFDRYYEDRKGLAVTTAKTESFGGRVEWSTIHENMHWYLGGDLKVHQASGTRSREPIMGPTAGRTFNDNV
ncbi:hypothetical protein EYV94_15210 [Puteibacter caeruleilacunae]|nr:hypothetical protein EYV94_15210 [Puteibacter caeruleilacunae]